MLGILSHNRSHSPHIFSEFIRITIPANCIGGSGAICDQCYLMKGLVCSKFLLLSHSHPQQLKPPSSTTIDVSLFPGVTQPTVVCRAPWSFVSITSIAVIYPELIKGKWITAKTNKE